MCTSSIMKPFVKLGRGLLGISKPKAPVLPAADKAVQEEVKIEVKEQIAQEEEDQKEERQKRLQDEIRRKKKRRGGTGKRSLITGQGGGIGYFDETL